jgi:glucosamine-6-phosphate deaminase
MRIIIVKDYDELSKLAAEEIASLIKEKPNCVLGLATGSSPVGMYKELIQLNKEGRADFSKVTTINLDEYRGLAGENPQSYRYFMNTNLFNHINIDKNNTFVPNGMTEDITKECRSYDERIQRLGGIDLQVLGIGNNGHIGFNEPSDYLNLGTHLTDLSKDTIDANSRFFETIEEVPTQAITMGLGGIMRAKKVLLLANGEKKADIIGKLVEGKISTSIPASILQVHSNVLIIVDEAAGAHLKKNYSGFIEVAK